jgi:phosphoketolase
MGSPLADEELGLMDADWRAANYLSVGQIHFHGNPLLKEPLTKERIKPRLLGHWGTTPGRNLIYVHLNPGRGSRGTRPARVIFLADYSVRLGQSPNTAWTFGTRSRAS